jgi:rhodanese-related sulfurtransferase
MQILTSAVTAAVVTVAILAWTQKPEAEKSREDFIRDFYLTEAAVHVSPHSVRTHMMKGINDSILVDLRSREEYERGHIAGAMNIPAYKDPDQSDYGAVERIVNAFRELQETAEGKDIVVYCYSTPCMTGRKVGNMLAENGIYVMHLGIGWNEWRYGWEEWNHEHEWEKTDVLDYVATGTEPGTAQIPEGGPALPGPCSADDAFGC